jgi:hypothetical protein
MLKIGIDISLKSTAIVINNNEELHYFSFITKKADNVWLKKIESFVNITSIVIEELLPEETESITSHICTKKSKKVKKPKVDYSKSEIHKLDSYNNTTDIICETIIEFCTNINKVPDIIQIEGYSQESQQGRLIDIVTFSTLLRIKIRKSFKSKIVIISPSSMKKAAGALVYGIGKDKLSRNNILNDKGIGKASGSFNKFDMLLAMKEYQPNNLSQDNLYKDNELKNWIVQYYDEIMKKKKIPSPIDDLVDAFFLQQIIN